jgi:peptide-methionine (R)-S-oxide reductase
MAGKIQKTDAEWKRQLTPNQYYVTRHKGTEPPFTGEYESTESPGTYKWVCCGNVLFRSDTKFHSGCGWPSFYDPAAPEAVEESEDRHFGAEHALRTTGRIPPACATACSRCGAHLGHVFDALIPSPANSKRISPFVPAGSSADRHRLATPQPPERKAF